MFKNLQAENINEAQIKAQALQAFEQGADMKDMLAINKETIDFLYARGLYLYENKNYEQARKFFILLTLLEMRNSNNWVLLGNCCQKLELYEDAITYWGNSLIFKEDYKVLIVMAKVAKLIGNMQFCNYCMSYACVITFKYKKEYNECLKLRNFLLNN